MGRFRDILKEDIHFCQCTVPGQVRKVSFQRRGKVQPGQHGF